MSFIMVVISLIVKMMFRPHYNEVIKTLTTFIIVIGVVLWIIAETALEIYKRKKK